jgi:hypothetical protein
VQANVVAGPDAKPTGDFARKVRNDPAAIFDFQQNVPRSGEQRVTTLSQRGGAAYSVKQAGIQFRFQLGDAFADSRLSQK